MAAAPVQLADEVVLEGHHWARSHREMAGRDVRRTVHAAYLVDLPSLEEAIIDHGLRTLSLFLIRLKKEVNRPVECAGVGKNRRCSEQHRRMTIVTTTVVSAVDSGTMSDIAAGLDWEGIHIGT
jgi:hypothetical protein